MRERNAEQSPQRGKVSNGSHYVYAGRTSDQTKVGSFPLRPPRLSNWEEDRPTEDETRRSESLRVSSAATAQTREFFNRMSADGVSPASLRAARITETDLQDPCESEPQATLMGLGRRIRKGLEETFMLARFTFRLLSLLGLGWRWNVQLWRLLLYAFLLLPGFIQMGVFYLMSKRVLRSIPYGQKPRNRMDIYVPRHHWKNPDVCIPVVIYVTGGAWTIGYKAWGSLLGRRLSKNGVIVCCLDYRNFPQGTALDMMEDVNTGISWILKRIRHYGGDPNRVYLVGQSCGAQLSMMCLVTQVEQEESQTRLPGGTPKWPPQQIKGIVGISGVYNCYGLADHLHRQGLYRSLFDRIMSINGEAQLKLLSPIYCIKGINWGGKLPPVLLLHGDSDTCAPIDNADKFARALEQEGAQVELKTYRGQTHTSPLIENPMRGGRDLLLDDILAAVTEQKGVSTRQLPLCPELLIWAAAVVCPF